MTIKETIEFIRHYNRWRRGDESIEQPHPRQIGISIDNICDWLESAIEENNRVPRSPMAFRQLLTDHKLIPKNPDDETNDNVNNAFYEMRAGYAACECGNEHLADR
jgi:hypothetical protein